MEEQYLRLLISLTHYLNNPLYYYPLLSLHLLEAISLVIYSQQGQSGWSLTYSLRLLNNLLVNDWRLTHQIMESFVISKLISLHSFSGGQPKLQQ